MSELGEKGEQEVREETEGEGEEEEEEEPEPNSQPGGGAAERPAEVDRGPGTAGEEPQAAGGGTDTRDTSDVQEAVEEAETQVDLPETAEQLREPQRAEHVGNSTATVKVVLVPEGHVMTVAFAIGLSIWELKRHLASELRVPAEVLHICLDGTSVEEQQSLMELGVRPHGSTRMEMSSADPITHPLRPLRPPEHDSMPDVITVRVQTDDGVFQEVVVEIERPLQQKAFLGGYRHRLTGEEYHHASVQTPPKRRPDRGVAVSSCGTQTVQLKSKAQQCPVSICTQTTGIGCYVSCMNDKLVTPGKYTTADEYHDRRLRAVIRLQAFARGWLAQQAVMRLRGERERRLAWMDMMEKRRRREEQEEHNRSRWRNPRSREDFNLLYQALKNWRCEEEQRINSSLQGAERKAALCLLLEQETQLIADIGRHRIAVQNDNYDKTIRNLLDKAASPHQWLAANGHLIQMDTPNILRARELRDLYNDVNLSTVSTEQRLEILITLKHTVKEQKCPLTKELVDLIDREVDLTMRGTKVANLAGLRMRISMLFLQYIKTPAFNPSVAKLLKVPQNPSQLRNDMFKCSGCHRYLRSANFSLSANARRIGRCQDCARLDNIARSRDDFSRYQEILRRLRADEQSLNEGSTIPFLLQVEDLKYLVDVVWMSRSALSHTAKDLAFVRWERKKDWSPWNCILLSREETSAHLEVEDVEKMYESTFIRRIKNKHIRAQQHFSQIPSIAEYLDSRQAATLGNQLICKTVTIATRKLETDTAPASAH